MGSIWQILVEFLFRLTLGIAVSMGVTSSRLVTSGFFRIHLWVLMGICTFAVPAIYTTRHLSSADASGLVVAYPIVLGGRIHGVAAFETPMQAPDPRTHPTHL